MLKLCASKATVCLVTNYNKLVSYHWGHYSVQSLIESGQQKAITFLGEISISIQLDEAAHEPKFHQGANTFVHDNIVKSVC